MNKLIVFFFTGFFISCAGEKPGDAIQSLKWVEGTWVNDSDPVAVSSEIWKSNSLLSYSGYGMTTSERDTLFFENLDILQENGYVFYIADVGNGPVRFKLTSRSQNKWVFSNSEHDFPKKIIYSRFVSGNEEWLLASAEGDEKQVPFKFKKVKK